MTLLDIAERCEKARGADTGIDFDIDRTLEIRGRNSLHPRRFTGSLDAAIKLVPEDYWWTLGKDTHFSWATMLPRGRAPDDPHYVEVAHCRSPALALCAAALRARALLSTIGESNPDLGATQP